MKKEIINGLLNIEAVDINLDTPYIWASGINAPIYCDFRKTIGHATLRKNIASELTRIIQEKYPTADVIGGTATAGIPHATSVADRLDLPLIYFRSKPKDHGTNSVIEGDYQEGMNVVIVEDLISTGGSVLSCVKYAREAGLNVLGVVAIFDYELKDARENFSAEDVNYDTVLEFSSLYDAFDIDQEKSDFLATWRTNPRDASIWEK